MVELPSDHRYWPYRKWLASHGGRWPLSPDLDSMPDQAIRYWLAAIPRGLITAEAAHAFPGKPPAYVRAYRILVWMAHAKLRPLAKWDANYNRLPIWAQWRSRFPVTACIPDGQGLKKPKRRNPLELLKTGERSRWH